MFYQALLDKAVLQEVEKGKETKGGGGGGKGGGGSSLPGGGGGSLPLSPLSSRKKAWD